MSRREISSVYETCYNSRYYRRQTVNKKKTLPHTKSIDRKRERMGDSRYMRIRKEAHIINVKRSKSFYCINYYYFAFDEVCMCVAFAQKLMLVNVEEPAMPTAKMNVADVHKSTTIFFSLFLVLPLFKRNNKKKVKIPRGKIYTRMAEKKMSSVEHCNRYFLFVDSPFICYSKTHGRKMPCLWIIIIWIHAFYVLRMPNNNEYDGFNGSLYDMDGEWKIVECHLHRFFFFKQRLCPINYTPVHGYISKKNCYTFPPPPTIDMHGFSLANVLAFFRIRIIEKENFSFAGNVKKRRKKKLFVCG